MQQTIFYLNRIFGLVNNIISKTYFKLILNFLEFSRTACLNFLIFFIMYLPSMTASETRVHAEEHSQGRQLQQTITLSFGNCWSRFDLFYIPPNDRPFCDYYVEHFWASGEYLRCSGGLVPLFIRFRFVL